MPTGSGKSGTAETLGVSGDDLRRAEMQKRFDRFAGNQPDPDDDARTKREWAKYLKADRACLSVKIDAAVAAGEMEVVTRRRRNSAGVVYEVTCYRWLE